MPFNTCVGVFAVGVSLVIAPRALAQAGHAGHDQRPASHGAQHKMTMSATDDAHFVEMMTKHHKEGVEMSKLEESRGSRDNVKALAAKIREGQEKDLQELAAHHGKHGDAKAHEAHAAKGTTGSDKHGADMQKHHEMMQKMSQESMQKIQNASGADVDHAFAHEMAMHHEMALEMIAKTKFKDAELRKFAQRMAANQKKELQQLRAVQKK